MENRSFFAANTSGDSSNGVVGSENDNGGKPDTTDSGASPDSPRFSFVNPADLGNERSGGDSSGGVAGEPERKRRKYTRRNGSSKAAQSIPVEGFAEIIFQGHAMLAALTKTQELMLAPDEAVNLAKAVANVSRHYDVQLAAKTIDWTNLLMACATVYGTRLMAVKMRVAAERKANPAKPRVVNPNGAVEPGAFSMDGVGQVPEDYYNTFTGRPQ